jgi:hypothetical protein
MGKSWSKQMIDLLVEEVMEVVGVGEGAVAVAEAVEVEAVEVEYTRVPLATSSPNVSTNNQSKCRIGTARRYEC